MEFNIGTFRRRQLPHWDVDGAPVFITACAEGSLSAIGLQRLRRYRKSLDEKPAPEGLSAVEWKTTKSKLVFAFMDNMLDHQSPVRPLEDPQLAEIVQTCFFRFAGERYHLYSWCVMPSHHHWLFLPLEPWSTESVQAARAKSGRIVTARELISQSIQSYSANECNRARGVKGRFWQNETFDHWVRNDEELTRIIQYIERNPVKAGLVKEPHEWPWSSAAFRIRTGTRIGEPFPGKMSSKDA